MSSSNLHVGDYSLQTLGSIDLQSTGNHLAIDAGGEEGVLSLSAADAAAIQSGSAIINLTNEDEATGIVSVQAGELGTVKLGVGAPIVGSFITLEPEMITISVGAPGAGASITLTPESITLKVAEVTFSITPGGIFEDVAECTREHTPEGHNLTAAETEFNVGVQGESKELPTAECEVEAGKVHNETLGSDTTDALKNNDAGIMMQV